MRLLLSVCLLLLGLILPVGHGAAADDLYTVNGIKVDASAPSTVDAQTKAIESGRDRAWRTLYRRLTRQEDWPRQPALDASALQRLIRSYQVHDPRSSTTRFVADMSYVFNANAVRRVLQQGNIAYSDTVAKPILVIPLGPDWSAQTPWARAWADPRFARDAIPLVLPRDDAIDSPALSALRFDSATWQDVEPMASRLHAVDAYLALVIPQRTQMLVKIRRLGRENAPPIPDLAIAVAPHTPPSDAFGKVADATANAIIDSWKARTVVDYGRRSSMVASAHVNSLAAWSEVLQELSAVPTVTDVKVVAMDIGEARLEISYVGSTDQLNQQLARSGLALANQDGQWWLGKAEAESAGQ
ncbi:MAG TPA: hypothetical protein VIY09_06515 [Rhizomicrobium sp.]